MPTPKGGLNISNQIIYINCARKHKEKDKMENKEQSRKWMDREQVRSGEDLERQVYSSERNYQNRESNGGELAYANWN